MRVTAVALPNNFSAMSLHSHCSPTCGIQPFKNHDGEISLALLLGALLQDGEHLSGLWDPRSTLQGENKTLAPIHPYTVPAALAGPCEISGGGGGGHNTAAPPVGAHLPQAVTDSRESGRQGTAEGILWSPGAAPQHHCSQPGSKANVFEGRQRETRNETYSTNREGTCHWAKANTEAQGGCSSAAPSPRSWRVTGALPMGNRSVQAGRGRGESERKNKQTNK